MSTDPHGLLIYGYALGGCENVWDIRETVEKDWTTNIKLPWYDQEMVNPADWDLRFIPSALRRLYATIPGAPVSDNEYDHEAAVQEFYGVKFFYHGAGGHLSYVLGCREWRVEWAETQVFDLSDLVAEPHGHGFDKKLDRVIGLLGITPNQEQPGWVLASLYM